MRGVPRGTGIMKHFTAFVLGLALFMVGVVLRVTSTGHHLFAIFLTLGGFSALAIMPATIASEKGRGFFTWWVYGTLLLPIALIHSLCIYDPKEMREYRRRWAGDHRICPFCAEVIKNEAVVCRFCGRNLPPSVGPHRLEPTGVARTGRDEL